MLMTRTIAKGETLVKMRFGHDITSDVNAAIALVNTAPEVAGTDELTDPAALDTFLRNYEFRHTTPTDTTDLEVIRGIRAQLAAVLDADSMEDAAELVNEVIAASRPTPRMTNHDDLDWHIDFHTPGSGLADHIGVEMAMAVATLMISNGRDRIRRCAAPDCQRYLADLSRNGSRRYCQGRNCGNRVAVRAYRSRRQES